MKKYKLSKTYVTKLEDVNKNQSFQFILYIDQL